MIGSPFLSGRDRYERVMDGRVDNTHDDAFTHTVQLRDDDRALEIAVVALPSPTYAIREARLTPLAGRVGSSLAPHFARLAGTEMVGGLTRRVAELLGREEGAALAVDATIEVARLARQAAKMPRAAAERAAAGDPLACWTLDTTGWADLPNSCFTYSAAGRALFGTRTIATPMVADVYSPRPGQLRVFERRKVARLERSENRLVLFHSMHDNVHGFELTCEIDLATDTIVRAEHVTPRLPYQGVCSEPQRRFGALLGERADRDLRKRIQVMLGGEAGCAQLYDLTADLLKLLS
jgi:Protein of unknown function (DUF2889)